MSACVHQRTCTNIAASFTIVKAENNSNVHQLMMGKYQWNVYTVEYCLAMKINEVLTHAIAWKKLGEKHAK